MIKTTIPYSYTGNLAEAYNDDCSRLADDEWILLTDRDILIPYPDFGHYLQQYIAKYPECDIFTCLTNRIGHPRQLHPTVSWEEDNMREHNHIAQETRQDNHLKVSDASGELLSGLFMLFSKKTWEELRQFTGEGLLGIDTAFFQAAAQKNKKVYVMTGFYVYHWYRGGNTLNKTHLTNPQQSTEKPATIQLSPQPKNRKAIITANIGAYDELRTPQTITKGWDYLCFTDRPLNNTVWESIELSKTHKKSAREAKIYHLIRQQYDCIIWIDANIEIKTNLNQFVKKYHKSHFTIMDHNLRNCTYQEGQICAAMQKDRPKIIKQQLKRYQAEGFPENTGMVATGIFIANNTPEVKSFMTLWWNQVSTGSKRDQLSFNYTAWKLNFSYTKMPYTHVIGKHFELHRHKKKEKG